MKSTQLTETTRTVKRGRPEVFILKPQYLKQVNVSNMLLEYFYKLKVMEQRILHALIANIHMNHNKFYPCSITISDFLRACNLEDGGVQRTAVERAAVSVLERVVHIPHPGEKTMHIQWVSKVITESSQATISLELNESLSPYLLQLKHSFTSMPFNTLVSFKSMHTIKIYMALKKHMGINKVAMRKEGVLTIKVKALRRLLGYTDTEMQSISSVKEKALQVAFEELNTKSDIKILSITDNKDGRTITSMTITYYRRAAAIGV